MNMVTNLAYFYESAKKVRGGKFVWWKDGNGENRRNVLLGGTILNPKKGFDHLYAAQLVQYEIGEGCYIFRSFAVAKAAGATDTVIYINGDGYSDVPEAGMLIMVAPNTATATGQSAKVTGVEYIEADQQFKVTVDTALGALAIGAILVEAAGTAASASARVLVPNPNTFVEADRDLMPTDGFGISNANYSISTVYDKMAFLDRMQPLPAYVKEKNKSLFKGVFWI